MMRVLLDTHSFLWFLTDDPRLSKQALAILKVPDNDIVLSMASLWEIAIMRRFFNIRYEWSGSACSGV